MGFPAAPCQDTADPRAVNIGLPILECRAAAGLVREGDLMAAGGLVAYTRRRLGLD